MDSLPPELLQAILQYLRPSDRLTASTVCLSWYEASLSQTLWKDLVLCLENSIDEAILLLSFTRKPIQHIRLKELNLSSSSPKLVGFWNHINTYTLSLEIHKCFITETSLLDLLLPCQALESLHFHDCCDTFITGNLLSSTSRLSQLKQALPNLKEICFSDNGSYLSDALFSRFMSLVSNLSYLSVSATAVSFHPGIHKKFYPEVVVNQGVTKSSELVLTFDCILENIETYSASVKNLDFSRTLINDKACQNLSKMNNLQLHSLLLRSCEVGTAGISAMCGTQSVLTELDVSSCPRITDTTLICICTGLVKLRRLSLRNCRAVSNEGISLLNELVFLEHIDLQGLEKVTSAGVERGLLQKHPVVLKEINLSATRITEDTIYQIAGKCQSLRKLDLTSCVTAVTDSSIKVLWNALRQLREIRFDWCVTLSDYGFLGEITEVDDTSQPVNQDKELIRINQFQLSLNENETSEITKSPCISDIRGLNHLSLCGCNKITDRSLQESFRFCDLRFLDLSSCSMITDVGLTALCKKNRCLEVLVLNNCCSLYDNAICASLHYLQRLKKLGLNGCVYLTRATLDAIESCRLQHLSHLDISNCKKISLEFAYRFQQRNPRIREMGTDGLE